MSVLFCYLAVSIRSGSVKFVELCWNNTALEGAFEFGTPSLVNAMVNGDIGCRRHAARLPMTRAVSGLDSSVNFYSRLYTRQRLVRRLQISSTRAAASSTTAQPKLAHHQPSPAISVDSLGIGFGTGTVRKQVLFATRVLHTDPVSSTALFRQSVPSRCLAEPA